MFLVNFKGQTALAVNGKQLYLNNSEALLAITATKVFNCQYQPCIDLYGKYMQRKYYKIIETLNYCINLANWKDLAGQRDLLVIVVMLFSTNYFDRNKQTAMHIILAQLHLCSITPCARNLYAEIFGD